MSVDKVLDPVEGGEAIGEDYSAATIPEFFKMCEKYRDLLKDVHIVVPVRPGDGMNCHLTRMLSVWYGEGTGWSHLNDHMGGFIEVSRANIAYDFKNKRKERYLLMIDNDMEPPIDLPAMLVKHQKPVVGACAMSMSREFGPQLCFTVRDEKGEYRFPAMRNGAIPKSGLCPVGHVGTGALMIRRDVFDAFSFEKNDIPFYIPEPIRVQGAATGHLLVGEDIAFCNALRAKGIPMHVDLDVHCGHRKTVSLMWDESLRKDDMDVESWRLPAGGSQKFRAHEEE